MKINKILPFFFIIFLLLVVACSEESVSENETINVVENVFNNNGLTLQETNSLSHTFNYDVSEEKFYNIDDGSIYLFYDLKDASAFELKFKHTLAEMEFSFAPNYLISNNYAILFIPKSHNVEVNNKIDIIFKKLSNLDTKKR